MPICPSRTGSVTMCTSSWRTVACGVVISSFSVSAMASRSPLADLLDAALHIEVPFRNGVVFAVQDFLEAADGLRDRHLPSLSTGEHLRRAERLAEETLDLPRPIHGDLVVGRQFIHAEDRDDVLQILEALEHALHAARDVVVVLADDLRRQR